MKLAEKILVKIIIHSLIILIFKVLINQPDNVILEVKFHSYFVIMYM